MPTSSETTIVRVSSRSPWFGSVKPTASKSLKSPFASKRPETRPMIDASVPTASDSITIEREHLPPRAAERPDGRELAGALRDRDRERVRDHEAADEERDPGEGEQEAPEEGDELVRVGRVLLRLLGRELDLRGGRQDLLDLLDELRLGHALLGGHRDLVELAFLVEDPLCRRQVEAGERGAADRRDRAEPDDARRCGDARPARRPGRRSSPRSSKFSLSTVALSITTSPGPGHWPSTSVSGLKTELPLAIEKPRLGAPP